MARSIATGHVLASGTSCNVLSRLKSNSKYPVKMITPMAAIPRYAAASGALAGHWVELTRGKSALCQHGNHGLAHRASGADDRDVECIQTHIGDVSRWVREKTQNSHLPSSGLGSPSHFTDDDLDVSIAAHGHGNLLRSRVAVPAFSAHTPGSDAFCHDHVLAAVRDRVGHCDL